jgi:hypothetical protein
MYTEREKKTTRLEIHVVRVYIAVSSLDFTGQKAGKSHRAFYAIIMRKIPLSSGNLKPLLSRASNDWMSPQHTHISQSSLFCWVN